MIPDYRFPDGFQITASKGRTTLTQRRPTLRAILAWAAELREDGWTVSEPTRYTPRLAGDMTRLDEGSGAA